MEAYQNPQALWHGLTMGGRRGGCKEPTSQKSGVDHPRRHTPSSPNSESSQSSPSRPCLMQVWKKLDNTRKGCGRVG